MKVFAIALVAVIAVIGVGGVTFATHDQKGFDSLDDAVNALVSAARAGDRKAMAEILGSAGHALVSSGDEIADRVASQEFVAAYDRAHRLEGGAGKVVLHVGGDDYPFPIPLVPVGPRWFWDTEAGKDEIWSRRMGETSWAPFRSAWPTSTLSASTTRKTAAPGCSSMRGVWKAPGERTMVWSGMRGPARCRARSALSSPEPTPKAMGHRSAVSLCPTTAISTASCLLKDPTHAAAPTTSSSRAT